jgi:hypothetical protein
MAFIVRPSHDRSGASLPRFGDAGYQPTADDTSGLHVTCHIAAIVQAAHACPERTEA